ncbi:hypothetical protein TNCV_3990921 [Trichonephila clavipes]|uniref:Uncharacterized protein n=1 Tax=Trichonephila clavipes TaxID=2585209 RepID=A0A8X6T819_TRICX|nr:hypothetical protein TNCV_3990921 [Trichonephila clavipes]
MVAERLGRYQTPVTTVDELRFRVEAASSSVPVHDIQSVLDSMIRRISAVITARGVCFCVVPARISSQSSRHCSRSPLPHASTLIQRGFGCVLGVQQTKRFPTLPKLIWCGSWGCNLGQSLSIHG